MKRSPYLDLIFYSTPWYISNMIRWVQSNDVSMMYSDGKKKSVLQWSMMRRTNKNKSCQTSVKWRFEIFVPENFNLFITNLKFYYFHQRKGGVIAPSPSCDMRNYQHDGEQPPLNQNSFINFKFIPFLQSFLVPSSWSTWSHITISSALFQLYPN